AGTVLVIGIGLGWPALAHSYPPDDGGWDIDMYDKCVEDNPSQVMNCCIDSGGIWDASEFLFQHCRAPAPPADPANRSPDGGTAPPPKSGGWPVPKVPGGAVG